MIKTISFEVEEEERMCYNRGSLQPSWWFKSFLIGNLEGPRILMMMLINRVDEVKSVTETLKRITIKYVSLCIATALDEGKS